MSNFIGLRREDKNKWERRTPLIPAHVRELMRNHPLNIRIQSSSIRIFEDEDYLREGAEVDEDLTPCPIILGIKEIPLSLFQENKVYLFFSHTIKGQSKNMPLLKKMMELGCTLIDYEWIVDEKGQRLLFFGRQAGQAGMIDTFWSLGKRLQEEGMKNPFSRVRQAYEYGSLVEAKEEIEKIGWEIYEKGVERCLTPLVFGIAGYGNVSKGAQEILDLLPVEEIKSPQLHEFMKKKNYSSYRIYKLVFKEEHMVQPVSPDISFHLQDYYQNPEKYRSIGSRYLPYLSVLVHCAYWSPQYPRFVTKKSLRDLWESSSSPKLKVISDISCDVHGSVECNHETTTPEEPVYVYDPIQDQHCSGIQGRGVVVLAVDNLPAELPVESSVFFSSRIKTIIPHLIQVDFSKDFPHSSFPFFLRKAVILHKGELTPDYRYLEKCIE